MPFFMSTSSTNSFGTKYWRNARGQLHRTDGPAIVCVDGDQFWFQNDQRHRTDGPAIVRANGDQYWYQNDQLHRIDGPAIVYTNGDQVWYQYGQLHRTDGPAIIHASGNQEWWLNCEQTTQEEMFMLRMLLLVLKGQRGWKSSRKPHLPPELWQQIYETHIGA
jgi:hypothetical protein